MVADDSWRCELKKEMREEQKLKLKIFCGGEVLD